MGRPLCNWSPCQCKQHYEDIIKNEKAADWLQQSGSQAMLVTGTDQPRRPNVHHAGVGLRRMQLCQLVMMEITNRNKTDIDQSYCRLACDRTATWIPGHEHVVKHDDDGWRNHIVRLMSQTKNQT